MIERRIVRRGNEDGMILFAVLAILGALAMVSATMFLITTTNVQIAGNHRESQKSFYQADAGLAYAKSRIESALATGTLQLTGATEAITITAPSGYNFDTVSALSRIGTGPGYALVITGRGTNAVTRLVSTFKRKDAMKLGVFGDSMVDMKANGSVYSYYSTTTPNPTPTQSTGEADIGSNEDFVTHNGTYIHGNLVLGEDASGTPGAWGDPGGGAIVTGTGGLHVPRVEPDPLGATGGSLAAEFARYATSNNNSTAVPPIPASKVVSLSNGSTMTLRAGNYHVNSIELKNGSSLVINATNGPVNIYLVGPADFKYGSTVNIIGNPTDFSLFSNSSEAIRLFNSSSFKGLVYAPYAMVEVKNGGSFYGLVWADEVDVKNSGEIYIDLTLTGKYKSNKIQLLSWKETRG